MDKKNYSQILMIRVVERAAMHPQITPLLKRKFEPGPIVRTSQEIAMTAIGMALVDIPLRESSTHNSFGSKPIQTLGIIGQEVRR